MKRILFLILAVAIIAASLLPALPARASVAYPKFWWNVWIRPDGYVNWDAKSEVPIQVGLNYSIPGEGWIVYFDVDNEWDGLSFPAIHTLDMFQHVRAPYYPSGSLVWPQVCPWGLSLHYLFDYPQVRLVAANDGFQPYYLIQRDQAPILVEAMGGTVVLTLPWGYSSMTFDVEPYSFGQCGLISINPTYFYPRSTRISLPLIISN